MESGEFEWDDTKAAANVVNHKISFRVATRVFLDAFARIEQDLTQDHGEDRFQATGLVDRLVIVVIDTERGDRIRISSASKANSEEQTTYHQG